jgi:serine/threonine protein kinase
MSQHDDGADDRGAAAPGFRAGHRLDTGGDTASLPDVDPAAAATISDVDGSGEPASMFRAGSFGDRYRGGGLLGAGGMGDVRLFADRMTGRSVAMKSIRRDREAGTGLRRFAREARIQAQLEHPAIVPVYDVGVDEAGRLYFTMKRVRGESLADVLGTLRSAAPGSAPRYTLRKLLTVLGSVAMAVEYAHSRGVIHRDLKPSNIMLGAFDEVYVLDWGLADVRTPDGRIHSPPAPSGPTALLDLDAAPVLDSSQQPDTATGMLVGTPGYVAPELLKAAEHAPDHRTDVYALGVILFEILTLDRLHAGLRVGELLASTLTTDGAEARKRAPHREIPPELDELCRRATRLDPAHRPQSARAFARAIEAFLDGDRNLAVRRDLAARSAEAAGLALARSQDVGSDEAALRTLALREVTAALGLDPDNTPARAALVRLLVEPPRRMPRGAEVAGRAAATRNLRIAARNAAFAHLTYALYVPLLLWMGVRQWWMLGLMASAITGAFAVSYYYYRRPPSDVRVPLPHLVASTLALASGALLFGPLVLVPAIVLGTGVGYIASVDHRHWLVTTAGVVVIVVPTLLQALGVLPPSYDFEGGTIRILPHMASFPPAATLAFLLVTHVVILVTCQIYIARLRREYLEAQARLRLQAWQLGQIVPEDARALLERAET